MRVEQRLLEFTAADLAFSMDEACSLFERLGTGLGRSDLESIIVRTEGWPAGIRIAGLALSRTVDEAAFVDSFRGTDVDIAEYLTSEVLGALPADHQRFMLETSLLQRLSGDLCDRVTAGPTALSCCAR